MLRLIFLFSSKKERKTSNPSNNREDLQQREMKEEEDFLSLMEPQELQQKEQFHPKTRLFSLLYSFVSLSEIHLNLFFFFSRHNEVDENGIMYSMSTPSSQKVLLFTLFEKKNYLQFCYGQASELPITFGLFSRPGNDPMKRKKENQVLCLGFFLAF